MPTVPNSSKFFILGIFLIQCELLHRAASLSVEYISAKLPTPVREAAIVYDGLDCIYLLGGVQDGVIRPYIYKFRIDCKTVEKSGLLASYSLSNSAQQRSPDSIFYFGGSNDQVVEWDLSTNRSAIVATLPYNVRNSASVKYSENSSIVYIFCGNGAQGGILRFDMDTLNSTIVDNLPDRLTHKAAFVIGRTAYIIGGRRVYGFNMDNGTISSGPRTFPEAVSYLSGVSDGRYGYVLGSFRNDSFDPSYGGIMQFNPDTFETSLLQVDNAPWNEDMRFTNAPNAIYVQRLQRIYFFGGTLYNTTSKASEDQDDIWYINLGLKEDTRSSTPCPTQGTTTRTTPTTVSSTTSRTTTKLTESTTKLTDESTTKMADITTTKQSVQSSTQTATTDANPTTVKEYTSTTSGCGFAAYQGLSGKVVAFITMSSVTLAFYVDQLN